MSEDRYVIIPFGRRWGDATGYSYLYPLLLLGKLPVLMAPVFPRYFSLLAGIIEVAQCIAHWATGNVSVGRRITTLTSFVTVVVCCTVLPSSLIVSWMLGCITHHLWPYTSLISRSWSSMVLDIAGSIMHEGLTRSYENLARCEYILEWRQDLGVLESLDILVVQERNGGP